MTTNIDHDERRRTLDAERRETLMARALRLDAELSVLTIYSDERERLGYDYGNGQRHAELIRVRRERQLAISQCHAYGYGMGLGDLTAGPELVREVAREISTRRLGRYARRSGVATGRTYELAREAWLRTIREIKEVARVDRELAAFAAEVSR